MRGLSFNIFLILLIICPIFGSNFIISNSSDVLNSIEISRLAPFDEESSTSSIVDNLVNSLPLDTKHDSKILNNISEIGFLMVHNNFGSEHIVSFFESAGYSVELIYSNISVKSLSPYEIVFAGEGDFWSTEEIEALEEYITNGGIFIAIENVNLHSGPIEVARKYGISLPGFSEGVHGTTTIIDPNHPLMENVSSLYIPSGSSSLIVAEPAKSILWDSTNTGVYGTSIDIGDGKLLILAGEFYYSLYNDDNSQFFRNMISWRERSPIVEIYSSKYSNNDYNLSWKYNFKENETNVVTQIFLDDIFQGSTSESFFIVTAPLEGDYNISVTVETDFSNFYHAWQLVTFDYTIPEITYISLENNTLHRKAYLDFNWTVNDNLSGIKTQFVYQHIQNSSIYQDITFWSHPIYGGTAETTFNESGTYILEIRIMDNAGNTNITKLIVNAEIIVIGIPLNHAQDGLWNIQNYYQNEGCYIDIFNESTELTSEWFENKDLVLIGGSGFESYSRQELLDIEEWFTNGGWVLQVGGTSNSLSYSKWLTKIGLQFGNALGSSYSSNFNTSFPLFENVNTLYFDDASEWQISDSFNPVIWDQGGSKIFVGAIVKLGTFLAIGGNFNDGIYQADNRQFLMNILDAAINTTTDGVFFNPASLLSNSTQKEISWNWSLSGAEMDHLDIWVNESFIGSVTNHSVTLHGLNEGNYNITIIIHDNQTHHFRDSQVLSVDQTPPSISSFRPLNGTEITVVFSNSTWISWDNHTGVITENLMLKSPTTNLTKQFPDPFGNGVPLFFQEEGVHILKLEISDWAGNLATIMVEIEINFFSIGFIQSHYEGSLSNVKNYCYTLNGRVETLYSGQMVTLEWLNQFDLIWIGYGGNLWERSEIQALSRYYESGGWIFYNGRQGYSVPLMQWFNLLGLEQKDSGPGSAYSSTFLHNHPIFENVSQFYLRYSGSWNFLGGDFSPIAWSQDGFYQTICALEYNGAIFVSAGDLDYSLYNVDNVKLVENIISGSNQDSKEGVYLYETQLLINTSTANIGWRYTLTNTTLDYFEVYYDEILQGNTTSQNWTFSGLTEGTHNLTVLLCDNQSKKYVTTRNVLIDLTAPVITLESPSDGAIVTINYLNIHWSSIDTTTFIIQTKLFMISPSNSSWSELALFNQTYSQIYFPQIGQYSFKISVWDRVGNRKDEIFLITVDIPSVGFVQNHYEDNLGGILSYYSSKGYIYEYIYSDSFITFSWLSRFDVVFIGYGGSGSWIGSELSALEDYLDSGGWVVYVGRDTYATPLESWLNTKGISFNQNGPGSLYTTNFYTSHPLFQDITQLYFRYTYRTWTLSGSAQPIIWSEDGTYIVGAFVEGLGGLIALSGDIDYYTHYANNEGFLDNILKEAEMVNEGIALTYSSLMANETTISIDWNWYLENTTLDYFEIYLDSLLQGNTTNDYWPLSGLTEGVFNITINLYDNASNSFSDSRNLIVDLTTPIIEIIHPLSGVFNQTYSHLSWNASDALTGVANEKAFIKIPSNSSWTELYIEPWNPSYVYLSFYEVGEYQFKISVWDNAGNRKDEIINILVDIPAIGIIQTHSEDNLGGISNYYSGQGYIVDHLNYEIEVTTSWLTRFEVVFIGYGGSGSWTGSELSVLEDYLDSGGWVVYVGRDTYATPLESWLGTKGISFNQNGPGSLYTTNFYTSHPLFQDVTQLYFRYTYRTWTLSGNAQPIIWSEDGTYIVGAFVEGLGGLLALSGDIDYYTYYANNEKFLDNILKEANMINEGIAFTYSSLMANGTSSMVNWNWYLENTSLDYFEILLDSLVQGNTTSDSWLLSNLTEGVHNVIVYMYDNNSNVFYDSRNLIVDLTSPIIEVVHPYTSIINQTYSYLSWNASDALTGIADEKAYIKRPSNSSWTELYIEPWNPSYAYLSFYETGEYEFKISVWDYAGNRHDEILPVLVDIRTIGIIQSHFEDNLGGISSFYNNQGFLVEYLNSGESVTFSWLTRFDVVFIGYSGSGSWTSTELTALENYLDSGGWVVYVGRDTYSTPLESWLGTKGITFTYNGPGTIYTSTFENVLPLFNGINELYLRYTFASWTLSGDAQPIIWSNDWSYIVGAFVEGLGGLIALSGDINYRTYYSDNEQFLLNILDESIRHREGISIQYSSLYINRTDPIIKWNWYLENTSLDRFEIYLDGVLQGNTTNSNWQLNNLVEGYYDFTIKMYNNNSQVFNHSRIILVDLIAPEIYISSPESTRIMNLYQTVIWNATDDSSGISILKVFWKISDESNWTEISLNYYDPFIIYFYFPIEGEYSFNFLVWDRAGNLGTLQLELDVDVLNAGFVENHNENRLYNLLDYLNYQNIQYEYLFFPDTVTYTWLMQFDIVFIGYGGDNTWTSLEFDALDAYLDAGGWILFVNRDSYTSNLYDWFVTKGIGKSDEGPNENVVTSDLNLLDSLMNDVETLYFRDVEQSLVVSIPASSMISYAGYVIGASYDSMGKLLVFSGDITYYMFEGDNEQYFNNILLEAYGEFSGIRVKGGPTIFINATSYDVVWFANPPNETTVLEYIVVLDGVTVGFTSDTQYLLTNLEEGQHTIKIIASLSNLEEILYEQTVIVDTVNPAIDILSPVDSSDVDVIYLDLIWVSSDIGSGINTHRIEDWDEAQQKWNLVSQTLETTFSYHIESSGTLKLRIIVFDNAGNTNIAIINVNVVVPEILYVRSHNEYYSGYLTELYQNLSIQKVIRYEPINETHLSTADIVIICGGSETWEPSELSALTDYLNKGGTVLIFTPQGLPVGIVNFLANYGLSLIPDEIEGGLTTYHSHRYPLFKNVTNFWVPTTILHLGVSVPSASIVYDPSGEYSIIAKYEGIGKILLFACHPNEILHHGDNNIFFSNIIDWINAEEGTSNPQDSTMMITLVLLIISLVGVTSFLIIIQKFLPLLKRSL